MVLKTSGIEMTEKVGQRGGEGEGERGGRGGERAANRVEVARHERLRESEKNFHCKRH